jgi:hypothetical protein
MAAYTGAPQKNACVVETATLAGRGWSSPPAHDPSRARRDILVGLAEIPSLDWLVKSCIVVELDVASLRQDERKIAAYA